MEIKKGISQMAEYPNVEINYVVPMDGQMYYVLRDGVLSNGAVIATLDPKRAIDANVVTDTIGVFAEDGSVLIDFDKKEIRKINDEFLLVVNSIPKSQEVVNALKNEDDEISKTMMRDNATTIVDKMMIEMGITGEMLFSDAYSEANIYKVDKANSIFGVPSSFIGKNDNNFYFHTNNVETETTVISIEEEKADDFEAPAPVAGFEIPSDLTSIPTVEAAVETPVEQPIVENPADVPVVPTVEAAADTPVEQPVVEDSADVAATPTVEPAADAPVEQSVVENPTDASLDINQSIFGNFKPVEDEISSIETTPITEEVESVPVEEGQSEISIDNNVVIPQDENVVEDEKSDDAEEETEEASMDIPTSDNNDAVLDNVIAVMKKMIEETSKLNKRITELEEEITKKEEEIKEKDEVISREESKKNTLNDLLDEANEVLDNIE